MAKDDDVELDFQEDVVAEHAPDLTTNDPDLIRPDEDSEEESDGSEEKEESKEEEVQEKEEPKEIKEKPKPKPRKPAKEKIREQYSRIHALEDQLAEMDRSYRDLETKLQYSNMAATQHFDDSVTLRLEKAKQLKKAAYESGDVDSMLEADTELAKAVHAQQQSNLWKVQNEVQNNYAEPQPNIQAQQYEKEMAAKNWAAQNSWFYPGSNDYDPQLARQVETVITRFEDQLRANGYGDLIGTPQYLQEVDKYVDSIRYDDAPQPRRSLRMKTQGHVSPPGRTSASIAPSGENIKLSKLDARWADDIGMSHKEYAKFIAAEREAERNERRR